MDVPRIGGLQLFRRKTAKLLPQRPTEFLYHFSDNHIRCLLALCTHTFSSLKPLG